MSGLLIPDVNNPNKWKHLCVYGSLTEWEENFESFRLYPKAQESTECGVLKMKYKCVHWRTKCQYQACVMMDEKVGICQVFESLRAHNHPFDQIVADNSMSSKSTESSTQAFADDLSTSTEEERLFNRQRILKSISSDQHAHSSTASSVSLTDGNLKGTGEETKNDELDENEAKSTEQDVSTTVSSEEPKVPSTPTIYSAPPRPESTCKNNVVEDGDDDDLIIIREKISASTARVSVEIPKECSVQQDIVDSSSLLSPHKHSTVISNQDLLPTLPATVPACSIQVVDVQPDSRPPTPILPIDNCSSSPVAPNLPEEEEEEEAHDNGDGLDDIHSSTTAPASSDPTSDEHSPTKRKSTDIMAPANDSPLKKRKIGRLDFFLDESLTSDPLDMGKYVMEYRDADGNTFNVAARFKHHLKIPPPSEQDLFRLAEMRDEIESLADEFDYSAFQLNNIIYFTPPGLRPITGNFLRFFDKGDVVEICEHLDGHFRQNFFWPKSTVANFRSMARRVLKSFLDE